MVAILNTIRRRPATSRGSIRVPSRARRRSSGSPPAVGYDAEIVSPVVVLCVDDRLAVRGPAGFVLVGIGRYNRAWLPAGQGNGPVVDPATPMRWKQHPLPVRGNPRIAEPGPGPIVEEVAVAHDGALVFSILIDNDYVVVRPGFVESDVYDATGVGRPGWKDLVTFVVGETKNLAFRDGNFPDIVVAVRSPAKAIHRWSGDQVIELMRAPRSVSRSSCPSSVDQSQISGEPLLSET